MKFYEVAFTRVIRQDSEVLTYSSKQTLALGVVVSASVGKRSLPGLVWREVSRPAYETKPLAAALEAQPLPTALLSTAQWMSSFYSTHLALVLQTILPAGLGKNRRITEVKQPLVRRERANFVLNNEQQQAVEKIMSAGNQTILLHGKTGAGKTAVYIEVAKKLVASGRSVIMLTPEISLTPQLTAEFENHFSDVIVTHSQLTEAERHQQWRAVLQTAKPQVIIGPRSALFMPVSNLGAIIIDECHEPSYKQEQQPRYTTARVARILANHHQAALVLGSATPSLGDYYLAQKHGVIATLAKRAKDFTPPVITLINAKDRAHFTRHPLFSTALITAMNNQLAQQKQVLLFHNRRGSASSILCKHCGWHAACGSCMLPLTLHADQQQLRCHVCGDQQSIPAHCPVCKHADVIFKGIGTKGLEAEVKKLFPKANVARFDADTEHGQKLHQQYQAVYDGAVNVIIGTQLIAKGLDLPKLGLAAIVQADTGLLLPDFQARERTFQLISQACGRVGRQGHQTDVIVQTFYTSDPVVSSAVHEDYATFYEKEISERRRGLYPPFTHLLKLICSYKTEANAVKVSRLLATQLRQSHPEVTVIGPTPAFYERLRGNYRWQITVKSSDRTTLQAIAKNTPPKWQVELDPHSLLS